jgi:hypothetical protein
VPARSAPSAWHLRSPPSPIEKAAFRSGIFSPPAAKPGNPERIALIQPSVTRNELRWGVHLDTILAGTRRSRSAGVLACGFGRRLAARIGPSAGPRSGTLREPAAGTATLQEPCQDAPIAAPARSGAAVAGDGVAARQTPRCFCLTNDLREPSTGLAARFWAGRVVTGRARRLTAAFGVFTGVPRLLTSLSRSLTGIPRVSTNHPPLLT